MIHLHTTLLPDTNTSASGQNSGAPRKALDSFHGELSEAVSSTMEKFGIHPNEVKSSNTHANVLSTISDKPVRSIPPEPGSPSSPVTSPSSTSPAPSTGPYDPFAQGGSSTPSPSGSSAAPGSSTESTSAPLDGQQAFDNAYWAEQPAAVQALRTMQNSGERTALATQLANEGYSIDVPIMVWGWDPSITTSMRQSYGYTWVPSALQSGIEMAPGLPSVGTQAAYDPNNPPPGSIAV
jgi:hypothetical protein